MSYSIPSPVHSERLPASNADFSFERVSQLVTVLNIQMGKPLDEHEIADLSQEIAIVVLRKGHTRPTYAPVEAWVHRVGSLEIRNAVRRKRRHAAAVMPLEDCDQWDAKPPVLESLADREALEAAMAQLPADDVELVRLRLVEEWTFDEIARRFEAPVSTIKTRVYRAVERLQCRLRGAGQPAA